MSQGDEPLAARQLLIMRHAKSSWADPGMQDFDRPLNARGRTAAPLMGQRLQDANMAVDVILASTAIRVRETLGLLLSRWNPSGNVLWEKQIYLASVPTLLEHLSAMHADWPRVMVVGHNPGLSELTTHLTGESTDMPTAAIAILQGPAQQWASALRHRPWQLLHYWTPKD